MDGPWGRKSTNTSGEKAAKAQEPFAEIINFLKQKKTGGTGGGSFQMPWLVVVGVLLLYLSSGFYRIQPSEQGIVLRFGECVRTSGPGLNWHLPWPFEAVVIRDITAVNRIESGIPLAHLFKNAGLSEHAMLTGDENLVEVNFTVLWVIKDLYHFLFSARDPEKILKSLAESVVREIVAQTPISLVLAEGRSVINQKAQAQLQKLADYYKLGVHVQEVMMGRIDPPRQVIDAYRDVQRARADQERMINDAEAYKNALVPQKRAEAVKMLREAEAVKVRYVADAKSKTAPFLKILPEYKAAPSVVKTQIEIATMAQILKEQEKIILSSGAKNVPILPLLGWGEQAKKAESPEKSEDD